MEMAEFKNNKIKCLAFLPCAIINTYSYILMNAELPVIWYPHTPIVSHIHTSWHVA